MIKDYYKIFDSLDKFKIEAQKTIEMIRKNLLRTRPAMPNRHQLEEYIKRIEFANEIILNLDTLINKTFNTYIEFISIYWEIHENIDNHEQQKILADKYDMSLNEWQGILSKIERFNETIKNFI
jgi:hypothetical protein